MIRVLIMIAVAGFLLAIVALSSAVAIGGPDAIARGAWSWGSDGWGSGWDHHHGRRHRARGPEITREVAWTGGGAVEVDGSATMTFTQAPGPAKLVITGPQRVVEQVVVEGGHIRLMGFAPHSGPVTIAMTAPDVSRFDMGGASRLTIEDYDQERLAIALTGNAEVTARGRTKALDLDLSGSAEADLGRLVTEGAEVDITGDGEATIAPITWAKLDITGSGDVTLLTRPGRLETDVSGAGEVHRKDGE